MTREGTLGGSAGATTKFLIKEPHPLGGPARVLAQCGEVSIRTLVPARKGPTPRRLLLETAAPRQSKDALYPFRRIKRPYRRNGYRASLLWRGAAVSSNNRRGVGP